VRSNTSTLYKISLLIVFILVGLLTKVYSGILHEFISNYLGGTIYVIFFIVLASLLFPRTRPVKISIIVVIITSMLEFSQLIHSPSLELWRESFAFRALFGSTFNPFDFIWYFVGALFGLFLVLFVNKTSK